MAVLRTNTEITSDKIKVTLPLTHTCNPFMWTQIVIFCTIEPLGSTNFSQCLEKVCLFDHLFRAVDSLKVLGGQDFHFPDSVLNFQSIFIIFPQTYFIFFLIWVLWVGKSTTWKGSGYITVFVLFL